MTKWSHSKLTTIIEDPMRYYLTYVQGIFLKAEKPALSLGSAVHWGLEHNTSDLTDYYRLNGKIKESKEKFMAECMVEAFLDQKEDIYKSILTDPETKEKLSLIEESHELYLTAKLPTGRPLDVDYHEFVGIIDLLLLTDKGFIVLDYKTSSSEPNWDDYLDQIYRYIMLLQNIFPDVPICKVGIINLRKSSIRQKTRENDDEFNIRLKNEYKLRPFEYIQYHEYPMSTINQTHVNNYILNLSKMCDVAYTIDKNKMFYINYSQAINKYGKSDYYDMYYENPDAYVLYKISDKVWDDDENGFVKFRDCKQLDMDVINHNNVLNKYSIFKREKDIFKDSTLDDFNKYIHSNYIVDEDLLKLYHKTYEKEI